MAIQEKVFLFMEHASKGDLLGYQKDHGPMTEKDA